MEINLGEAVQSIRFLSADLMDARDKATQENARTAEIPIVDAVAGSSGDFEGLANSWGVEDIVSEGEGQASATQELSIPTHRE